MRKFFPFRRAFPPRYDVAVLPGCRAIAVRKEFLLLLCVLPAMLLTGACAKKRKPVALPPVLSAGATEEGIASWYGDPYHGRPAASGEIYDMEAMTAAHRTLPFHTMVRVNNLGNGKAVDVRINDRGPFVDGRIIDLSRAAARAIEMLGPGTAPVRLVILELPDPAAPLPGGGSYAVQVGVFGDPANAQRLRDRLAPSYDHVRIEKLGGSPPLERVLVGEEKSLEKAERLRQRLLRELGSAMIVRTGGKE